MLLTKAKKTIFHFSNETKNKKNIMNQTKIHISRKLEKVAKEIISKNLEIDNEDLGDWAATLFYVSHKKCWLLINKHTRYLLILANITKSDLKNISSIFKETLYAQLTYEGIITKYELIKKIIGDIKFSETNNDKSSIGSLNNSVLYLEHWKNEFGSFEKMNFRDLNARLNSSPNKLLNWKFPKDKMSELLGIYAEKNLF